MKRRLALVLLLAACSSTAKPSSSTGTVCDQVRGAPSLHPSDWERLTKAQARKDGRNAEEAWLAVKGNVAANCPELLVRLTGS